jgi:tetratricopeptide (TPR) repeat protein
VDPEELAELRALGYLADPSAPPIEDELATLDLSGADTSDFLEDVGELSAAFATLDLARRASGDRQQEFESIVGQFKALAERHPNGLAILRGWVGALEELERYDEAIPLLARAVELAPEDGRLRLKFVHLLRLEGDFARAEIQARKALEQRPCGEFEISYLSGVLNDQQRYAARSNFLAERVAQCDSDGVRNEYAYFLATCADDLYRDGALALELAVAITSRPGGARLEYVDTLAAAQAETGDLAAALTTQRNALAALEHRDASLETLTVFREHLRAYEAGKPVREP